MTDNGSGWASIRHDMAKSPSETWLTTRRAFTREDFLKFTPEPEDIPGLMLSQDERAILDGVLLELGR